MVGIKTVVAGHEIADGNGDEEKGNAAVSEKLKTDEQRCDGTVGNAAEHGDQTNSRTDLRRETDKRTVKCAKGCADKERRDDLAAPKT